MNSVERNVQSVFRRKGIALPELMIAMGIAATLIVVLVLGVKRFSQTRQETEQVNGLSDRAAYAKHVIASDLESAARLSGSSATLFSHVRRTGDEFSESDAYDPISIYHEFPGEVSAPVFVQVGTANSIEVLDVFYQLGSAYSEFDAYFEAAFSNRPYFILTDSRYRNMVENLSLIEKLGTEDDVPCPQNSGAGAVCKKVQFGFASVFRSGAGVRTVLTTPETMGVMTLRVAQRVDYFVDSAANLIRRDDSGESVTLLPNVSEMIVRYAFQPNAGAAVSGNNRRVLPAAPIRSPLEQTYLSQVPAGASRVLWSDASQIIMDFNQSVPASLGFLLKNHFEMVPGRDRKFGSHDSLVKNIPATCQDPVNARCRPECRFLFTSEVASDPSWQGYDPYFNEFMSLGRSAHSPPKKL